MKVKESTGRKIFRIVNVLALLVISFICLAPIWYTVMASFSDPVALTNNKGALFWPAGKPTLEGYKLVLANSSIWIGYANILCCCWNGCGYIVNDFCGIYFFEKIF